jgi:hypothetical protein
MTSTPIETVLREDDFFWVYELPPRHKLANGYCFGSGNPIIFTNVDWCGAGGCPSLAAAKEFLSKKRYIKPNRRYLVLGSREGITFTIEPLLEVAN